MCVGWFLTATLSYIYTYLSLLLLDTTTSQDISLVPAGRLANIYAESKEFFTAKQQLEQKLQIAIKEPVGETPEFATNFLWQVDLST